METNSRKSIILLNNNHDPDDHSNGHENVAKNGLSPSKKARKVQRQNVAESSHALFGQIFKMLSSSNVLQYQEGGSIRVWGERGGVVEMAKRESAKESLKEILMIGYDKEILDPALFAASNKNFGDNVKVLLDGRFTNTRNKFSCGVIRQCFMMSLKKNHFSVSQAFISSKIDMDEAWNGKRPIVQAVKSGNILILRKMIDAGVDLSAQEMDGQNAVDMAAKQGNPDIIRVLKEGGATFNSTTLGTAIEYGHEEVMRMIREMGVNMDVRDAQGNTALMSAIIGGRENLHDCIKALIKNGASLNIQNEDGKSALMICIQSKLDEQTQMAVMTALVEAGAALDLHDASNQTALMMTFKLNLTETARNLSSVLLQAGADPNIEFIDSGGRVHSALIFSVRYRSPSLLQNLIEKGATVSGRSGRIALQMAAELGSIEKVRLLLSHGADTGMDPENQGETALLNAIVGGFPKIVQALLEANADPNQCGKYFNEGFDTLQTTYGPGKELPEEEIPMRSPLWVASTRFENSAEICQMLIDAGAWIHFQDERCISPVEAAAVSNRRENLPVLLGAGGEVNPPEDRQTQPLLFAAINGNSRICQMLVQAGANPNAVVWPKTLGSYLPNRNPFEIERCSFSKLLPTQQYFQVGQTPLMLTVINSMGCGKLGGDSHDDTFETLIRAGADLEMQDIDGNTVLHLSLIFKKWLFARKLRKLGANLKIQNKVGCSPLALIIAALDQAGGAAGYECTCIGPFGVLWAEPVDDGDLAPDSLDQLRETDGYRYARAHMARMNETSRDVICICGRINAGLSRHYSSRPSAFLLE